MIRSLFVALGVIFATAAVAQKIPLINSGEAIERGKAKYDSGKYEEAIAEYLSVPKRDTNYVYMLTELALAYIGGEKYDKAISTCDEGLQKPTFHRAHLLRSRATALDRKGEFDKAVSALQTASEEYPFDVSLIYNLGITYYNHKDYEKAADCFFKALSINPFHSGSHLNLGRMAVGMGRKTHAIFSFGMYLGINNKDNERLVFIDKFLSNQITDEGSVPAFGTNACEKLDQIIRARIAMDKNFKTKVPVDASVVKQYEMFFEQLSTIGTTTDDRWISLYLPIYKAIKDKGLIEPYMYHILTSASNEHVKKWRQKNEKQLNAFFEVANAEIAKPRYLLSAPASFGYKKPIAAWYSDANRIEALGAKDASDKHEGQWFFFHDNQQRSAEGNYSAGKKTGTWKYFRSDGSLKSIENYETGEVTVYLPEGEKSQHFFLKDDEIHGDVELYHPCGGLSEKLVYENGKRNGPVQFYYPNGKKNLTYQFVDDKVTGSHIQYFENGELFSKSEYKNDLLNGPYSEYYANGKLSLTGDYLEGKVNGTWKYYYNNGHLKKTGSYKNGTAVGEWNFYDEHGIIDEKRNFDPEGKWHGDNIMYHDGKVHHVQVFKGDLLVKITYFDKNGKELWKSENDKGTFAGKFFYPSGQLNGEGSYVKGKLSGPWKYYFPEGIKFSEYTYEEGEAEGLATEYFRTGAKKYTMQYKDNDLHGYFQEFHANGQVKQEGWFQDGQRQQQWLNYYPDGTLESDYFYLNDELTGEAYDYDTKGKPFSITTYDNGKVANLKYYNEKGEGITTVRSDGNKKVYEAKFASGKIQSRSEIQCGEYTEKIIKWFPDGNVFFSYGMMHGKRHGEYKYYEINNQLLLTGNYVNGSAEGLWKAFTSKGQVDYFGKYLHGEYDSLWTYLFPHEKISSLANFKNDKRHGVTLYNSPEGTPVVEKLYDRGNLVAYRLMNSDGKFGDWITFTPSASISANYPSGSKAYEEFYKNGLLDGARRLYFSNGTLYSEYNYKWGDYDGPYKVYYPNGKLREKGEYKNDELNGTLEMYNEDGSLFKTETFINGTRDGKSVLYKNGTKVKEIMFSGGLPQN